MESSIAVFLMRQLAYEQLPTVSHHNICFHQVGRQHSVASTVCCRADQCHMQQNNTTCTQQQYHTMASIRPLDVEREREPIEGAWERQHHTFATTRWIHIVPMDKYARSSLGRSPHKNYANDLDDQTRQELE